MHVTALLPVPGQPRFHKRIRMLQKEGMEVSAAGLVRDDYFAGAPLPCPFLPVGRVQHGHYSRRLFALPKVLRRISAIDRADVHYCFGTEMGIYGMLSGKGSRVVVEVADIRSILTRGGVASALARRLDDEVIKRADLVVVTSEAYLTGYYAERGVVPRRSLVVENRVDRVTWGKFSGEWEVVRVAESLPVEESGVMTIGYFGLLRCHHTWSALRDWAGMDPSRRRVLVRGYPGVGGPSLADLTSSPGVDYRGPFVWPDELQELYGAVDLVCAAYPVGTESFGNWKWARTNRFYEACLFRRPLLVLEGSADASAVGQFRIGSAINFRNGSQAVEELGAIRTSDVLEWRKSLSKVPEAVFLEDDDGKALRAALEEE